MSGLKRKVPQFQKKTCIFLGLILLVSAFLRFYKLGEIPVGHTNDEANYIYSAYSVWHTGHDLAGNYLPLSFNLFNSFSPVPVYLIAPFLGVLGLSPFAARLPFALVGVGFVFLSFLLARKLLNNDFMALATAFILAVSPWHLQLSRIAYGGTLALFFYTLAIYIFLATKEKGNVYWSLPAFLLGFYSYHGTKIFFLFFVPFLIFNFRDEIFKKKMGVTLFVTGFFLILASFFYVSRTQGVTRQEVFIWNNLEEIARSVDQERLLSTAPLSLKVVFSNKLLSSFWQIGENYLQVVSPGFLFLEGETGYSSEIYGISSKYGTFSRGMLYLIELPLLLLGIAYLFGLQKKTRNFLLISLLLSPLPAALAIDQTYGMRCVMMLPFLAMIVGGGFYFFLIRVKEIHKKRPFFISLSLALFSIVYLFFISDYLYHYYFRYPLYSSESWLRSRREVAELIGREKGNYEQVYLTNAGDLLIQYAIFNQVEPKLIQAAYQSESPQVENVYFIGDCLETNKEPFNPQTHLPPNTLYITHEACHEETTTEPIGLIKEVGEPLHVVWKIYERKGDGD